MAHDITDGGVYKIQDFPDGDIHITTTDKVFILDISQQHSGVERNITLADNADVEFYQLSSGSQEFNYDLNCQGKDAQLQVKVVLTCVESESMQARIQSQLTAHNSLANMHILALVGNNGKIILDGVVNIGKGIAGVSGHILEESVFLGSKGQITGIPSLLVHSNDVQAGHAARVERISDEKLYYLRSRGVPKDDATVMMIRSSVAQVFEGLQGIDEDLYDDCIEQSLNQVL